MTKNWYFWAALVLLIGLSVAIARKAAQDAKENKRWDEIASGNTAQFNPRPYTDALFIDCYVAGSSDSTLYTALMKMQDEQIRKIFLDWNDRYKSKKENENRTLAQAIRYAYSGWFAVGWTWVKPFIDRLVSLGLE